LVWVEKHLNDAFAVTHVDKNQPAQIATAMNPTTQGYGLIDMATCHLTTVNATHDLFLY
jgi:hypothetical protein